MTERELTEPVALCLPNGSLNREAVGWSRRPLHDTSGIGRGIRDRGRNKRWEYWAVLTPTHIVSLTVSSTLSSSPTGVSVMSELSSLLFIDATRVR